jgi:hypothetical protein
MIIDCEASLVVAGSGDRVRYSRAKIGLAADSAGSALLVVITSQFKEKFKIVNNCSIGSTTISFKAPKKDLYIKSCDQLILKAFMSLMRKILKRETIPKLANISSVEKLKPKPISLSISGNNYNINDLTNKCLTKLFCDNLKLIPRLVWKLNNLTQLKLTSCQLNEIPINLNDLGLKLKLLDLSHNSIQSIDGSFLIAMKQLNHLDLSFNQLNYLSFEMKALKSLEHLNVSNNRLCDLPFTLGHIMTLKFLDLSNNNLQYIPFSLIKEMLRNVRLSNLDISGNPLREPLSDFTSSLISMPSLPSLKCLSSSAILSNDHFLYKCHQLLPQFLYRNIQMNGEKCSLCFSPIVNRDLKLGVIHQSLELITNCMSTSHFPSFPLVPAVQYICNYCLSSKKV